MQPDHGPSPSVASRKTSHEAAVARGFVNININEIENFANWQGVNANGRNYIDELLAHEVGHVLGIGTLWVTNGLYSTNSFHYTGVSGLAAYQAEFNQVDAFIPVENAGNPGTPNAHWDQLMRSSPQEGNPSNPWGSRSPCRRARSGRS